MMLEKAHTSSVPAVMPQRAVAQEILGGKSIVSSPLSVEGISGFKDALMEGGVLASSFSLDNKPVTHEGAMKAAQDVLQGFYTQVLKMLFSEIKPEDSGEESGYESSMVKDIFVEQLGVALGKNVSSFHEKIAESILAKAKNKGEMEVESAERDGYPPKELRTEQITALRRGTPVYA